jgi:hypothetical protein
LCPRDGHLNAGSSDFRMYTVCMFGAIPVLYASQLRGEYPYIREPPREEVVIFEKNILIFVAEHECELSQRKLIERQFQVQRVQVLLPAALPRAVRSGSDIINSQRSRFNDGSFG